MGVTVSGVVRPDGSADLVVRGRGKTFWRRISPQVGFASNEANPADSEGQPNQLHVPLSSSLLNRMNTVQHGGHIRFETLSETSGGTGSMSDAERTTPSEELARTLPTGLREVPPPITSQRRPNPG